MYLTQHANVHMYIKTTHCIAFTALWQPFTRSIISEYAVTTTAWHKLFPSLKTVSFWIRFYDVKQKTVTVGCSPGSLLLAQVWRQRSLSVSSRYSSFLPLSKDIKVSLTWGSKLPWRRCTPFSFKLRRDRFSHKHNAQRFHVEDKWESWLGWPLENNTMLRGEVWQWKQKYALMR